MKVSVTAENFSDADTDDMESNIGCNSSSSTSTDMQDFTTQWVLKLGESRKLTRSTTQEIVEDVNDLVSFVVNTLKRQTHDVIRANGLDTTSIVGLSNIFDGPATRPFDGLTSFYQHLQYCRKNFNLIVRIIHGACSWCIVGF